MKPSEFYSTITNYPVGNTSGQFIEQQTESAYTIYTNTGAVSEEAYWLGYIRKENLPLNMQHNHWVVEGDGASKTVKFINDTDAANFPCGYVKRDTYSYTYSTRFITDGVARSYNNSVWWTYFLNDLHPEYSAAVESSTYGGTSIIAFVYYKNAGTNIPRGYNNLWTINIEFRQDAGYNLKDCIDFLEGNKTITVTSDNINGQYYTFDITIDDDLKTLGYKEFTSNEDDNITMMYILTDIRLPPVVFRNGNSHGYFLSQFASKITWTDNDNQTSGEYNITNGHDYYHMMAMLYNGSISRSDDSSGAEGEFNYNELTNMNNDDYIINGNIFVANVYNYVRFYNIRNAVDLLKAFSLIYRVDTSSSNAPVSSYVDGVTYATDVSSTNEFLAKLKTGNISDETFRNGLRYWQYSSITNNDFDEEDIPPYEPEPGEEGEESGDKIVPQFRYFTGTTNFITQYAMKNVHVSTFGHLLWTSWVNALDEPTDMWKNFILAGQSYFNTGSFNVSDAIDFIVSLKLFPFNIPNSVLDSPVDNVIIGTGAFPIAVENIYRINSPLIYLDFGTINVPRPYGDFRDYENMNISLMLPYCGTSELNPGDVVGRSLRCRYAIDLQSGSCTAIVTTWDDEGELYPVVQIDGQIGCTIPLTATNTGQLASRVLTDVSNVSSQISGRVSDKMHSLGDIVASGGNSFGGGSSVSPLVDPDFYSNVSSGVNAVANALSRPAISCPSISGGAGLASFIQPKSPYLQMRYGLYSKPDNYNHSEGVPSTKSGTLSEYSGFTVCANVDVSSLTCHSDEKRAIKELLETGVYL